jgi:ankyrin repeat protein
LLVSAFPEGADIKDGGSKRRPSEWLKEGAKCNYGNNYKFLLHKAAAGRFSRHLVKLLLQAFPESIKEIDRNGLAPLHYACLKKAADISIDVVLSLLAAHPSAFTMPNPGGKSPHHLIMEATCKKDENGMVLLHHVAGCTKDLSVNALDFLVHINPDSVLLPDRNQMLPFHHACLNSTSSLDVILRFIQLYPEGIFSCKLVSA